MKHGPELRANGAFSLCAVLAGGSALLGQPRADFPTLLLGMLVAVCGLYFVCIIVQLMLWLVSLATRPKTGSESREVARALWMDSLWSFVIASPVVSAMTGIAALLAEPGVAFRILLASAFVVSSVVMVIRGGRRYAVSWKRLVVAYILGLALHWRLLLTVHGL